MLLCLFGIVVIAAFTDLREQRVPNWLTGPGLLCAFALHGIYSGLAGLGFAVMGAAAGFGLLIAFYAVGGMGAGDVKLMAVVGGFLGVYAVFWVFLVTGVVGGFYAVLLLLLPQVSKLGAVAALKNAATEAKVAAMTGQVGPILPDGDAPKLCYAVCIAIAVFAVVMHGGPLGHAVTMA